MKKTTNLKLDIFPHIFPLAYFERMKQIAEGNPGLAAQLKRWMHIPVLWDLERRIRMMKRFPGYKQILTLATVFAIEFTMPVWASLLAWMFLKERLTFPRLVMLAFGLAGVLVILRPGAGSFHPAALAMVLGSLCYASSFIFTKRLISTDSALAVLFWMAVIQTPISLAAALPQWVAPVAADVPWVLAIGVGSFTAHYCMTRAMKLVDAMVAVPIDFIRLPLIASVGAVFYGEALDPMVLVGAAIIFAGTYYSLSRERT